MRRVVNDVTLHFDVLQSTVVGLYGVKQELAQRRSTGKKKQTINVRPVYETQIGKGRKEGDQYFALSPPPPKNVSDPNKITLAPAPLT